MTPELLTKIERAADGIVENLGLSDLDQLILSLAVISQARGRRDRLHVVPNPRTPDRVSSREDREDDTSGREDGGLSGFGGAALYFKDLGADPGA